MSNEEKDIYVEQPNNIYDQGEEISQNEKEGQDKIDGSTYGKFKSGKALLEAYNNLQSEFTKKCQALAKLQNIENVETPIYLQKDWGDKINNFISENPEASDYIEKIVSVIKDDKSIADSENPIAIAWSRVATENFKSPKSLVSNLTFLEENIFNNEDIKKVIIERYINEINNISSPRIMGGKDNSKVVLSPLLKPKTLQEASRIAKEMMK